MPASRRDLGTRRIRQGMCLLPQPAKPTAGSGKRLRLQWAWRTGNRRVQARAHDLPCWISREKLVSGCGECAPMGDVGVGPVAGEL